jgi:septum formation protein
MSDLWLLPRPLLLASKSQARRALLAAAGIPFEGIDAAIDERAVDGPARTAGALGDAIAGLLAEAKARAVSAHQPGRLVLGADQTLTIEGSFLSKPPTLQAAKEQLLAMSGKKHTLHAALCLVRDETVVAAACAAAHLTCRHFTSVFVDAYLGLAGESVLQSVGGYAVEGLGIHLFERIEGEQSTILGLPMLPLLDLLRTHGALAT